jgi:SAM-dependent methyltransferase
MSSSLEDIISGLIEFFRPHLSGIHSVLDIGTGTSIPIHVFYDNFPDIRYMTVDVTDIRKRKDLPFLLYDGRALPFGDEEFDVSLLNETLHHCDDPVPVLTEAIRVAGMVFVVEHFPVSGADTGELVRTEMDALANFEMNFQTYNPFTEESLFSLFDSTGLKILDKTEIPYYGKREIKKYFFRLGR